MAVKKKVRKVTFTSDHDVWTPKRDERVLYRDEIWYIEKYVKGDRYVRIRNTTWPEPDEKYVTQAVPVDAVIKWHTSIPPAGNGPELSEAEKRHRLSPDARRRMDLIGMGADAIIKKHKRMAEENGSTTARKRGEPRKPRDVKPKDPNAIPLKKICAEVNIDPKIARRLLRAEKSIPRPEGRWEFDKKDVERIKKVITQPV